MKISELIAELEKAMAEHGDVPVEIAAGPWRKAELVLLGWNDDNAGVEAVLLDGDG